MTRTNVITGSFGSGKTTAIRRLMTNKPPDELWMVILNEFTEAGLDALSVAEVARGQYDVRLVAGGCLCCVGEAEFGKQLNDILKNFKPTRLLIEPSGAGHAADIVDTLGIYEAQRTLRLDSIICLVDSLDAERILATPASNDWSQIQSADVLLLSKPDLAGDAERRAFDEIAAAQYPAKRYIGDCSHGELPPDALQSFERAPAFTLLRTANMQSAQQSIAFPIGGLHGTEIQLQQLGLWGISWLLPSELNFSQAVIEPRLTWLMQTYEGWLRRLKAVFRTGPGPSWFVQSHGRGLAAQDSAYRRDSRLEIVLTAAPTTEFLETWRTLLRDATNF